MVGLKVWDLGLGQASLVLYVGADLLVFIWRFWFWLLVRAAHLNT